MTTDGSTLGVEEEFLLVGPGGGRARPWATAVLGRAGEPPGAASGGGYHLELFETQIEAATGVCRDLGALGGQLRTARARLARAAAREGLRLVSSGTPVPACAKPRPVPGDRFALIRRMYSGVVSDYQVCGCHVHVGVADRDTAVAVVNHLRPWLPTLLALSANSPFDRGRDSGYASWRMMEQARFPGSGVPPWFASAADHDRQVDRLVDCGALIDPAMTFWLARPSAHLPTVEVRAADAVPAVGDALLQAALTRALVRTALADLAAGREARPVSAPLCAAAVWNAARHGLEGPGVDLFAERPVPAERLLDGLVERVRPALEAAGETATVLALLDGVRRAGTGAARQRRAAAGGPGAVIELLACHETEPVAARHAQPAH